jgi:hypothetical protein
MAENELANLLKMFEAGSGFGDPEARRNAEQKLQYLVAKEQQKLPPNSIYSPFFLLSLDCSMLLF